MKKLISVILPLAVSIHGYAQAPSTAFVAQVRKTLSSKGQKVAFSLRDPDGNEVVNVNGGHGLAPASIAKTVSTACSLDVLGPQFQFETLFGYTGKIQGDVLTGDLVIQGAGDPSLVIEDLTEVVEKLRFVHGIKSITGNLVFDVSYLGKKALSMANGFEGDEGRSFAADITPTIFNQNSFSIWVTPDVRGEGKARVVSLPANVMDVEIQNKVKVSSATEVSVSYSPNKLVATVGGSIARDGEPKGIYRAVDDPYDYDLKLLKRLWLTSGGEWKNPEVKISNTAVASKFLWKQSSRPLAKILMDVNKFSLNLGAELIFLAAGAEKYGRPATYEKSLKLLKECLASQQVDAEGIVLTNGSGLSREASIRVSVLSQFLQKYSKSTFSPEYLSSFGLLGIDGTSKTRLKKYSGRARLKTGSLKDVRSVAGYLYSKDHKTYSFAMIQNSVNSSDAKALEDQVLEMFLSSF